ncbi:hypothetical protein BKA63DRAFT_572308 [Paraphoma chrysanthemicola]|nr:hypothetical protein BKA63DRAFT_572308 [Paraphoma chrysanthemicola]
MAIFTRAHVPAMLNSVVLFLSLALVSISIASIYLTAYGMKLMDREHPSGHYDWYRGPWWDTDLIPQNMLRFDDANEAVIFTTGAISCIAGLIGIIAFFVSLKPFKITKLSTSRIFLLLPATIAFLMTLVGLIYATVIFKSNHHGQCYWENGYYPNNTFICTRELAACNIVSYFRQTRYNRFMPQVCGATQTGRHLIAPLFAVSTLLFAVAIAKVVMGSQETVTRETADERVERLQREEE